MNTNAYTSPDVVLSKAAVMVGDTDFKSLPRGFYIGLIQEAFEKLALTTYFMEKRANIDLVAGQLVYELPTDCFNVRNVYIFSGDICDITTSAKVWWKRNYYTRGTGYLANDKGQLNYNDPFYENHALAIRGYADQNFARTGGSLNNALYYNFQMGNIMLSSSCINRGNKLNIHYNSTGCEVGEAPIIPVYLRRAMEDYVITNALLARMANDPGDIRKWQSLYSLHDKKLNDPYNGSWQEATLMVSSLNTSQIDSLAEYLGRGQWQPGL